MNCKKILLSLIVASSVSTHFLYSEAPRETILDQESGDVRAKISHEQRVAINLDIQKECSRQVDLLTAILQQIVGGIQKGIIPSGLEKNELLKKLSVYMSITHQLQSMSVLTAQEETLAQVTIILKNCIDRLTVAVDSELSVIDVPTLEELVVPDKNYTASLDYVVSVLMKNEERLTDLAKSSTSLGLTFFNKTVRYTESFLTNYTWPLVSLGLCVGGYLGFQMYHSKTVTDNINAHIAAFKATPAFKEYFTTSALLVGIAGGLFHKKLGEVGSVLIDQTYTWASLKYRKLSLTLFDMYNQAKGIKNVQRDGLATTLENTPTLDDPSLIGLEDQKRELYKMLDYLSDPELYIRSDNEIAKCFLLIGPSRCGKTALAKAMAATIDKLYSDMGNGLKVKFIEVNYLMITNIASLKEVISYAFQTAPCILFIDEIHLLGLQKTGNKELLNEFLTQLTELHRIKDPAKQVFIIGATNHPELLAPELFKHERFGKVIRFKKPGIRERAQFFASNFEKYGINPAGVDLLSLVLQTKDCDYGHLQQIVKDARFEARAQGQGVSQAHLQRTINSIVHGIGSTSELTSDEAHIAAIDQAGKIVAHKKLQIHETIHLATISKVDGRIEEDHFWLSEKKDTEVIPMRYGTIISTSNREEIPFSDAAELEKLCKRSLAGICAQTILLGTYHIDYTAQDYKEAFEVAQKIILKGLTLKSLPPEQQNRVFKETEQLLQRLQEEVMALLSNEKVLIEKLVTLLKKERCITGKEIESIVQ